MYVERTKKLRFESSISSELRHQHELTQTCFVEAYLGKPEKLYLIAVKRPMHGERKPILELFLCYQLPQLIHYICSNVMLTLKIMHIILFLALGYLV